MQVVLNGKSRSVAPGMTVAELVRELGFANRQVVVELNGEPIERNRYGTAKLDAGDVVEIVRPVQGG